MNQERLFQQLEVKVELLEQMIVEDRINRAPNLQHNNTPLETKIKELLKEHSYRVNSLESNLSTLQQQIEDINERLKTEVRPNVTHRLEESAKKLQVEASKLIEEITFFNRVKEAFA